MDARFKQVLSRKPDAHDEEVKDRFLQAYDELGNIAAAAEKVGVKPTTARSWLFRYRKRVNTEAQTPESGAA